MKTLALNIRMQGRQVVVIGGGTVALRKLRTLLRAGAAVTLISKTICPEIAALADSGAIVLLTGGYAAPYLDDAFLVIAATDDAAVNAQISEDAHNRGILIAVADNPAAGNCIFPATLQRGDLEIAVSTGGRCPTFAVDVRDSISAHIGHEYGDILNSLAVEREKLLTNGSSSTYNTQVLRSLATRLLTELTERKESLP
ncbi:MAG: bifunctional precorrin-2 dehydrogenase/sirohydrochlorin ferrochelatase [Desulfuromonadaceae bacterium]|nr:bifunctional precorrin-2 dehydrogenase/sirohydrochlorin ferrochelatase [Desulfuromonadaceae bacterium]